MSKSTNGDHEVSLSDVGRSFLNSLVFISTSLLLLVVSCIAFFIFYHINVPAIGVIKPAHLQFERLMNPYALVDLEFSSSRLKTGQPYNVLVELVVPDTPSNHELGNFMVEVSMLGTDSSSIVTAARSAILKYASPMIDTVSTILKSGPILLNLREESQVLRVPVLESYRFEAGWLISPSQARLEIYAPTLQVYSCRFIFETVMQGLPWLLYTFKLPSFLIFTTLFWGSSMIFMIASWTTMSMKILPDKSTVATATPSWSKAKQESNAAESLSEAFPRMKPGSRKQAPSSIETGSFFEFDQPEESVKTEATTMDEDPYIKVEETSDTD